MASLAEQMYLIFSRPDIKFDVSDM